MSKLWFLSDPHFGQATLLQYPSHADPNKRMRPFKSAREMDDYIIAKCAARITPEDHVYFLGDLGDLEAVSLALRLIPGKKRIVLGNHDRRTPGWYAAHFQKVFSWREFSEPGIRLIATHAPLHPQCLTTKHSGGQCFNLHGHLHDREIKLDAKGPIRFATGDDLRYLNISVEQTNYEPVEYDDVMDVCRSRLVKLAAGLA